MSVMLGSLYDALRVAEVPDSKAREAAEEAAAFKEAVADVRSELQLLKSMVGANILLTVLVLGGLLWR